MKAGKTLSAWASELERQAEASRDFIAPTGQLEIVRPEHDDMHHQMMVPISGGDERFDIGRIAHGQIANRLKVPKPFYDRIKDEHPGLYEHTVNTLLHADNQPRMIRTLDQRVRAFLSNRYRCIGSLLAAEGLLPVLNEQPDLRIVSTEITERRMYLKAVFPRIQTEVIRGDVVQAGISISNSEVGAGSWSVQALIFRLVCENGMIVQDNSFKKVHLGKSLGDGEDASEFFRDETLEADDRALILKMQDVTRGFLTDERFSRAVDKLRDASEDRIEGGPVEAVQELGKRFTLRENEEQGVLRHLIEGGDLSRYGMMNAVTRTSQDVDDYDRATELETVGGQVIELSKQDWKVISESN